ncbi:MAG TPA: ABC transporter substrate-binding protein [Burkholderiales bacterium]
MGATSNKYARWIKRAALPAWLGLVLSLGLMGTARADGSILIGQSAPLSGSNKELGEEIRDGALAYFKKVNDAGGVNGRKIELISLDDGNVAAKAGENGRTLIEQRGVIALFGYASATLSMPALPFVEKNKTPFIAPFTGADPMRVYKRYVYNHRASYADELEKIIDFYANVGVKTFGVLYHDDAVGRENLTAVQRAISKRSFKPATAIGITRVKPDIQKAVAAVTAAKPDVLITTTLFKPSADFIKAARAGNPGMQFVSTSFAGPNVLMRALGRDGAGVAISQVVPPVSNKAIPVVNEYQTAFAKYTGKQNYGATSLESYIAAKMLVEALRHAGKDPTRESLANALDNLSDFDAGGYIVGFTPTNHNGSSFAEMTVIDKSGTFKY